MIALYRFISCLVLACGLLAPGWVDAQPTVSPSPEATQRIERKELRAGWYPWDPYQYQITKNGATRLTGLDVELLRAIFTEMGYMITFEDVSWQQHQQDVKNGIRDIAAGAFKSEERSKYADYSDAYRNENDVIYVRRADLKQFDFKSSEQWLRILQERRFLLGVIEGYYYGPDMMRFINDPANADRIVRVRNDNDNISNLLNKKVDAIAIEALVGETLVWRNDWQRRIQQAGVPIFSDGIHVIFSKATTSPALVASFNSTLKTMRETGEYQKVIRTYLLPVMLGVTVGQWWFLTLDIIGTIAFALSGVLLARQGHYSFFGALVLAAMPSIGGGVIRDVLLQRETLSVFKSPLYLILIFATVLVFYILFKVNASLERKRADQTNTRTDAHLIGRLNSHAAVAFFDAVGLSAFTIIGVIVAVDANIQPLWLWGPLLAALTGAGGGILRDVIRADVDNPGLKGSFYAEVALLWGLIFSVALTVYSGREDYSPHHMTALVMFILVGALSTRMYVFHYKIRSPMF